MIRFTAAIRRGFEQFAVFTGRATRAEYWWWALMVVLLELVIGASDPLWTLATLVLLVPTLAVTTRRLHDVGRSAWAMLWFFVPLVGWIILLVLLAGAGDPSANRHGAPPTEFSASISRGTRMSGLRGPPRPDWSGGDPGPTGWRDEGPAAPSGGSGWDGPPPPPPRP